MPKGDEPRGGPADQGALYDIGYRPYEGDRLARGYACRTLFRHSLRVAFGLERGGRALFVPWGLMALVSLPALFQVGLTALAGGAVPGMSYAGYLAAIQLLVALFCAGQAPELMSGDLRHQVLPLYFSRALRRGDYALMRLAAMVTAALVLLLLPMAILFVGRLGVATEIGEALGREAGEVLPVLGAALVSALVLGALSTTVAAFTRRRGYAAAGILGILLLTTPVAALLVMVGSGDATRYAILLSPLQVIEGLLPVLFDQPVPANSLLARADLHPALYGLAAAILVAGSVGVLLERYRRVRV